MRYFALFHIFLGMLGTSRYTSLPSTNHFTEKEVSLADKRGEDFVKKILGA